MTTRERPRNTAGHKLFPGNLLVEKSRSSIDSDSNWLITLSDVLSLLLVVFVMFFAMTKKADSVKTRTSAETPAPSPSAVKAPASPVEEVIRDEMSAEISRLHLDDDISVTALDREVIVTMKERVTFRTGEAEILDGSEPVLDNIARIIQRYPSFFIDIEGHTDNIPIRTRLYPSNWELSVARATSVLKYFINRHQIDPSRLSVKGNAELKPKAPNDSAENRAQNRRVEIRMREKETASTLRDNRSRTT